MKKVKKNQVSYEGWTKYLQKQKSEEIQKADQWDWMKESSVLQILSVGKRLPCRRWAKFLTSVMQVWGTGLGSRSADLPTLPSPLLQHLFFSGLDKYPWDPQHIHSKDCFRDHLPRCHLSPFPFLYAQLHQVPFFFASNLSVRMKMWMMTCFTFCRFSKTHVSLFSVDLLHEWGPMNTSEVMVLLFLIFCSDFAQMAVGNWQ